MQVARVVHVRGIAKNDSTWDAVEQQNIFSGLLETHFWTHDQF